MNQMVTISYEEQLKAKAKAVRQRLMGKGNVVNIAVHTEAAETDARVFRYMAPTEQMKKREPREHVNMWAQHQRAIRDAERDVVPPRRFIKFRCIAYSLPYEVFIADVRTSEIAFLRRLIIEETDKQFPGLSASYLGRLAHKDHTTILYMLGRAKNGYVSKWRKKMEARAE